MMQSLDREREEVEAGGGGDRSRNQGHECGREEMQTRYVAEFRESMNERDNSDERGILIKKNF